MKSAGRADVFLGGANDTAAAFAMLANPSDLAEARGI
jgi:hypothetical protein